MPRSGQSQWDFGESFAEAELRPVLTVSELTSRIKGLLEGRFTQVWVSGELSNLRIQSSGHVYFVLKDSGAQLSCVLFRGQTGVNRQLLREGTKLLVNGSITLFEPRGQYQLRVLTVEPQGLGALQAAFEKLKQRLAAEGLFDASRKRAMPPYVAAVGLVTSPTGAALQDILHVIGRRYPRMDLVLAPCRVQGDGAAAEIASAIDQLNRWSSTVAKKTGRPCLDVILLARGGGSLEDLWAFNEEVVARAIAASALPVVSAVGHEIDFTIADFVADLRAATPSAAAEILTQPWVSACEYVTEVANRLAGFARRRLQSNREISSQLTRRLTRGHPRRRFERASQQWDDLMEAFGRAGKAQLRRLKDRVKSVQGKFAPSRLKFPFARSQERMRQLATALRKVSSRQHEVKQARLTELSARLRLLSPQSVLDRGYSVTRRMDTGEIVRNARQLGEGTMLRSEFKSGSSISRVESTEQ